MDWPLVLLIIFAALMILMATGMPIAFCFMFINIVGAVLLWNGTAGLAQLILSIMDSVTLFALLPLPLFVLMGEVMFHAGIASLMIDALDKWLGRLSGRLALLSVGGGTLFATLTGASMSSVAMLGSVLVPEMEKRGYKKSMSLGPILGSGGLAIMIPPSGLAVLLGALGKISVGKMLVAIIIPGMLMAVLYASYIIGRCQLQKSIAPSYKVEPTPLSKKIVSTVRYILPLGLVIFLVLGLMFLGIATPTESAATGAIGTFILVALYNRLDWKVTKKSISGAIQITVMMFIIITGAKAFGQILAYTEATRGMAAFTTSLAVPPVVIIICMQIVVLIMGMLMDITSIMMITLPIFVPVVNVLGFDPVWFGVIYLLNMEMATTSPPFGLTLYVMKGVAPLDTTMGDIYRAALPFLGLDLIAMALIIAFPALALWLPGLMF